MQTTLATFSNQKVAAVMVSAVVPIASVDEIIPACTRIGGKKSDTLN
jgi:hypothetical protein